MTKNSLYCTIVIATLWAVVTIGCVKPFVARPKPGEVLRSEHVVVVVATEKDTLASLAQTYLGSSEKAWRIEEYNNIRTVAAGDRVVIPLSLTNPGGIRLDGYQTVPVLLYEKLSDDPGNAPTTVSKRAFEAQMQFAKESGCQTIRLAQLADFLDLAGQLPAKAIMVTFDTTDRWVYDLAYPILKHHGFTAAIFVTTARIGKPGQLDWPALATMAADGFDIGVMGHTGRRMAGLKTKGSSAKENIATIEEEIVRACQAVEKHLNIPCHFFAYPNGASDDLLVALLKKHGFRAAFTRTRGDNPFFIDNFKVFRSVIGAKGSPIRFSQNLTTFIVADLK